MPALTGLALGAPPAGHAAPGADLDGVGVVGLTVDLVEDVGDLLAQRLRVDAVGLVVGDLLGPAPLGLVDGLLHRLGDGVGVHVHLAGDVAGGAADGLNQAARGPQEAFLVGVQDRHQRHLGQVEALTQQVDADQHVVLAQPQLAQQLHPAQRVDLGVQVAHPDAHLQQVVGEVFGHLLGQRRDQHPFVGLGALADFADQIVDLPLGRLDHHLGIDQPGGADHLLDELAAGLAEFVRARGGRQVDRLADAVGELLPGERAVVAGRRQPEPVLDQVAFARHVAFVHAADLRDGDVGLVDDQQEVFREVVEQGGRRRARAAAVDVARVVLDARAESDLAHHLDVVVGAHPQPLGLQQLALALQFGQPLGQFLLDGGDGVGHSFRAGHVVGGREDPQRVDLADHVAGQRVQVVQRLDLVAEELDAHRQLFVGRDDLDGVAADPERAAGEGQVVAGVLDVDQQPQQGVAGHLGADPQLHRAVQVGLRRAQAVDARHRGHHHHVAARQQARGRRVPEALDVVVDGAVLFDVGVGLRDVRLGLVVVVVRHEVFNRVVRQHLSQFVGQLGGQRLVGRHHQRGPLQPLDEPGGGGRLAGAGGPEQHHVALPRPDAALELVDGGRLVSGRRVRADHLEAAAGPHQPFDGLLGRAVLRMRDYWMFRGKCHVTRVEAITDKCGGAGSRRWLTLVAR